MARSSHSTLRPCYTARKSPRAAPSAPSRGALPPVSLISPQPAPPAAVTYARPAAADTGTTGGAAGGAPDDPRAAQPERPTVSNPASTVAPGYAELETGAERDTPGDGTHAVEVPTELKLGLTTRLQLNLLLPTRAATDTAFGLGDLAVAVKWRVLDDAPVVRDLALYPEVKFNTGGRRGTGTTDATFVLIDSRKLGAADLDLNVGVTRRSGDGSRAPKTSSLWAAALGAPVRGGLAWTVELYGYPGTRGPAGEPPVVAVLTGPTFRVRPELVLDVGTIVPVAGAQPHALYAGLTANLGRVFDPRGGGR